MSLPGNVTEICLSLLHDATARCATCFEPLTFCTVSAKRTDVTGATYCDQLKHDLVHIMEDCY